MLDLHLPAEMLDHVVGHLHNKPVTLKQCCLVSKSWIPRTRKHLFADARFQAAENLRSWRETFPDPLTSPARYAKTLYIDPLVVTAADAEVDDWIRGFSRVEHLVVGSRRSVVGMSEVSFVPFRGFSPILKSLRVDVPILPSARIFKLILSFPLLEDLAAIAHKTSVGSDDGSGENEMQAAAQPSSSPTFTGSLELHLGGGMGSFARRLLSLQGGIHFRKLIVTWVHKEDPLTTMALVEACAHTLESLNISKSYCTSIQHPHPHR
jgi:hypothetical protein